MASFNPNWERWCKISINKHFDEGKGDTECFIEGFARDTDRLQDYFEIRFDGPNIRETTKDKWHLVFEVNVLVVAKIDPSDVYRINRLTGRVQQLFNECIIVRRWGEGPQDDQTVLGYLNLRQPKFANEKVQVSHFGQINPTTDILQASVEGHYEIRID
jgi:hypothetical protein